MSAILLPTHTCFDDVFDILKELVEHGHKQTVEKSIIVHAVCKLPDGRLFAHAWLEIDDGCWFCGIVNGEKVTVTAYTKENYYANAKVQEAKKYSISDLQKFGDKPAPWEEPFISLCSDSIEKQGT